MANMEVTSSLGLGGQAEPKAPTQKRRGTLSEKGFDKLRAIQEHPRIKAAYEEYLKAIKSKESEDFRTAVDGLIERIKIEAEVQNKQPSDVMSGFQDECNTIFEKYLSQAVKETSHYIDLAPELRKRINAENKSYKEIQAAKNKNQIDREKKEHCEINLQHDQDKKGYTFANLEKSLNEIMTRIMLDPYDRFIKSSQGRQVYHENHILGKLFNVLSNFLSAHKKDKDAKSCVPCCGFPVARQIYDSFYTLKEKIENFQNNDPKISLVDIRTQITETQNLYRKLIKEKSSVPQNVYVQHFHTALFDLACPPSTLQSHVSFSKKHIPQAGSLQRHVSNSKSKVASPTVKGMSLEVVREGEIEQSSPDETARGTGPATPLTL